MANKRFNDLPEATSSTVGDVFAIDGLTVRKITVENLLQPNLVAIKGLTSAADKGIQFTGSGTAATYDLTAAGKALLDDANAAAQRTTLGLAIGTDVQAYDADLAALAANASTGLWSVTGAGTGSVRTLTAPAAGITITDGDGVAGNPTLVLANDLAALEGLASTGIARRTGSDAWSVGTAVSNAELATMAAYTLKGNATGSSATPTDIDIAALTTKASPAAGDYVLLSDQDASGAFKKASVSSIASAGSVSSIAGNTGAFTLSNGITNSTNDIRPDYATKSEQETGTSTAKVVNPSNQKNHDSAAKAWVIFAGSSGTVQASYGVTSVSRSGAGQYVVTFSTAFASAVNYAGVGTAEHNAANTFVKFGSGGSKTTTTSTVYVINQSGGALTDPDYVSVLFFGRQ